MIKLELYKLKGVDDVAVAISANVNNFFGLFATQSFTHFIVLLEFLFFSFWLLISNTPLGGTLKTIVSQKECTVLVTITAS